MNACVHTKHQTPFTSATSACNVLSLRWKAFTSENGKSTVSHWRHGFKWLFHLESKCDCVLRPNRCFTSQLAPKWLQICGLLFPMLRLGRSNEWLDWKCCLQQALHHPALLAPGSAVLLKSLSANISPPFSSAGSSTEDKPRVKGKAWKFSGTARRSLILSFPVTQDRLTRNLLTQVVKPQEHAVA